MNNATALWTLLWKDTRLVLPLILMLPGVGIVLLVLWTVLPVTSGLTAVGGSLIPVLLPALFAAGAGAILVGQEKDQRTLWWVTSLPVPPRRIVTVKLVVALAGLAVMWLSCFVLSLLFGVSLVSRTHLLLQSLDLAFPQVLVFWVLHSVFILLLGFLTAWTFKNVFASLIALIPLACVPFALVQVWMLIANSLSGRRAVPWESSSAASITITALALPVTAWLVYRVATARLQPARPPKQLPGKSAKWREAWRPARGAAVPSEPFRFSLSSLVWQSLHHNRGALAGLVAAILVGMVSLALIGRTELLESYDGYLGFAAVVGLLSVSWLGVFAFVGDGSADRLRFLADRGVSPTLCWLGRQLIGVSVISLAVLLYAWLSLGVVSTEHPERTVVPSVATVAILFTLIYAFSQATSHWIRILAASAVLAPVLSGVAAWWLVVAAVELGAPLWLLLLTACLPLLGTWLTMRTYMDGSRLWPIFTSAGVVVLLVAALPAVPLAVRVARFPAMPDSVRGELAAQAARASASAPGPVSITLAASDDDYFGIDPMPVEVALKRVDRQPEDPAEWLRPSMGELGDPGAATVDGFMLEQVIQRATFEKLKAASVDGGDGETDRDSLAPWIEALTQLATRLRQSRLWDDQEAADVLEIWLTQTLSDPAVELSRDSEAYRSAVALLANRDGRNEARRQAVLASWNAFRQSREADQTPTTIGGMSFGSAYSTRSSTEQMLLGERYGDALVGAAIELIDRAAAGESTESARRRLHRLVCGETIDFEMGPYSERLRGEEKLPPTVSVEQTLRYPANQWDAGWEWVAASLAPDQ